MSDKPEELKPFWRCPRDIPIYAYDILLTDGDYIIQGHYRDKYFYEIGEPDNPSHVKDNEDVLAWCYMAEFIPDFTRPTKTEEELRELLTATCAAHRVCCNEEHDPVNGKISGYCVVCGVPWPCETAKRFIQAALTPQNKIK
jgi:hypothetical protein